ncbi:MAG: SPOR domain-containing protein [Pseudomonadota bacterium]
MNEQIKRRLVGAVVLVSLAVIFIPMLLDGGNNSSMPRFGSNIPQQPEFDFEPLDIPLQPVTPITADRPRVIDKVEKPAPAASKPAQSKPTEPVKSVPTADIKEVSKPAATEAPVTWVVQVGSFSQSGNALTLRDKLRKNGFTAFVEKYRDKGKSSYRVRVGPELKRENAEKQLQRIKSKLQLKGIIMGHS